MNYQKSCVIVVLGAPNTADGELLPLAVSRCISCIAVANNFPDAKILCTGGFGEHFNTFEKPHAELTKQFISQAGIDKNRFLPIVLSRFTIEDATEAVIFIKQNNTQEIILITSDFHMKRALAIFKEVFPAISIIPHEAKSDLTYADRAALDKHEEMAIGRDLTTLREQGR